MNSRISNGGLLQVHNQIDGWKKGGNALYYLLAGKVRDFYNQNGVRIQSLMDQQQAIFESYYEMTTKDGVKQAVWEGEGKDRKPKLKEGVTEEQWKEAVKVFQEEMTVVNL